MSFFASGFSWEPKTKLKGTPNLHSSKRTPPPPPYIPAPPTAAASDMPSQVKRRRREGGADDASEQTNSEDETLRETHHEAVNASVDAARKRAEEERTKLLAEAEEQAAAMKAEAGATKAAAEEMKRVVEDDRAALEAEKAAMEKAHDFQTSKIVLNVGGHRFETSRQTLTSVPHTYRASMFSGRFELAPEADGAYFIDRDGTHFRHVLNFLRDSGGFTMGKDVVEERQREELVVELEFYGLLDRAMPYYAQERIGQLLLHVACRTGTKAVITTAVAQAARALVFEMGSTTPFLEEDIQDLRWVITERVVNGSPVWASVYGDGIEAFMYRNVNDRMMSSGASSCAEGRDSGFIYNTESSSVAVAPTEVPSDEWVSYHTATLASQYASAERYPSGFDWAKVPSMRIPTEHGLDDDDPAARRAGVEEKNSH
jgi:hypothetical protein